jgi:lysophospholipase L1-like esterase
MKSKIAMLAAAIMLAACGGGGGNSGGSTSSNPSPTQPQPAPTGKPVLIETYGDGSTVGCTATSGAAASASCPAGYAVASTTEPQALQADLQASLGSSITVSNKGVFGTTADSLLQTWDATMAASTAQIVTVNVGLNDQAGENFSTDLMNIVQIAKAHGKTIVLFVPNPIIGPNPAVSTPAGNQILTWRDQIRNIGSAMSVPVSDDYSAIDIAGWVPLLPDGVYPNADGYKVKAALEAQILAPVVKPLL